MQARNIHIRASTDEDNFDMLQKGYQACMDTDSIQEAGVEPLVSLLEEISTLWPVAFDNMNSTLASADYANFSQAALYMESLGVDAFEQFIVMQDPVDPNSTVISVGPPSPTLSNVTQYSDPEAMKDYAQSIAQIFGAGVFAQNITQDLATTLAQGVVELELAIAMVYPSDTDTQLPNTYNLMSLSAATELAPSLSLDKIIHSLAPPNYTVGQIIVQSPSFLAAVNEVASQAPKAVIQSWMIWRAINSFAPSISSPALGSLNGGADTSTPRYKTCLAHVDAILPWIMSKFYIQSAFDERTRNFGSQMMTDIRTQFKKRIGQLDWMSDEVKKLAIQKVDNIDQAIGYPTSSPNIKDPDDLAQYYIGLNMTDSFVANVASSRLFNVKKSWSALGKQVDRGGFDLSVYTVNAYYQPVGNMIKILAGIMQLPVFSVDLPSYVSYGALGAVLGHELTHGFDNNGRLYDPTGAFRTWWDNETTAAFENRTQCFVDQFSNFTVATPSGPANVNGTQTLPENLADAGGLHTAFDTWQAMASPKDQDMPGLQMFTHEQLFYLFYGNLWCNSQTPSDMAQQLGDTHSPDSVRILGTTANSAGFRQAFNCPVKTPTCELW